MVIGRRLQADLHLHRDQIKDQDSPVNRDITGTMIMIRKICHLIQINRIKRRRKNPILL